MTVPVLMVTLVLVDLETVQVFNEQSTHPKHKRPIDSSQLVITTEHCCRYSTRCANSANSQ